MFYVLQYPSFTAFDLVVSTCDRSGSVRNNQIYNWLMFGKLPESINVTPMYQQELYYANAKDRYIDNVEVNPIPPTTSTVSLATGATLTLATKQLKSATSTNAAFAKATVTNEVLTITGVAAGTATITASDEAGNTIYTIVATVT